MSVSCRGVEMPAILTLGPMGMTAKTLNAAKAAIAGARKYRNLSARRVHMSSLKRSLPASAKAWKRPRGPATFGPGRVCMRPRPRRSTHRAMSTLAIRKTMMKTALMRLSHQVS